MKNRVKNPYFWLGLGGVIFSAAGVDFKTLTSWNLLGNALLDILANPVAVVASVDILTNTERCVTSSSAVECQCDLNGQIIESQTAELVNLKQEIESLLESQRQQHASDLSVELCQDSLFVSGDVSGSREFEEELYTLNPEP